MKAAEAHSMSDIELVEKLKEIREESFNLRLKNATGELEDTAALGPEIDRKKALFAHFE